MTLTAVIDAEALRYVVSKYDDAYCIRIQIDSDIHQISFNPVYCPDTIPEWWQ